MWNFLKQHGYVLYLGGILACIGFPYNTWEFWAVLVPVSFLKRSKKWIATKGYKRLGYFNTEEEAFKARQDYEKTSVHTKN